MNWWSCVTSANWLICSCVTWNHSPVPSSLPTSAWNSGSALAADSLMDATLCERAALDRRRSRGPHGARPTPGVGGPRVVAAALGSGDGARSGDGVLLAAVGGAG